MIATSQQFLNAGDKGAAPDMFAVALSRECFLFLEPKRTNPRRLGTEMRYLSDLSLYENLLQSIQIDGTLSLVICIAPENIWPRSHGIGIFRLSQYRIKSGLGHFESGTLRMLGGIISRYEQFLSVLAYLVSYLSTQNLYRPVSYRLQSRELASILQPTFARHPG